MHSRAGDADEARKCLVSLLPAAKARRDFFPLPGMGSDLPGSAIDVGQWANKMCEMHDDLISYVNL